MDSLFAGFVADANSIATSGRWEAVNATVERWAKRTKTEDELWYGQLFSNFSYRVFTEYHALKAAYAATPPEEDMALLAWRARNLLELSIWTTFCAKEQSKAWQFFEDLGRDANDFLKAFETWGKATNQSSDWFKDRNNTRDKLESRALARGITSIEGKFTKISNAAREVGLEQQFTVMNKLLSKYAHPTAMFILGNSQSSTLLKDAIFGNGCLFFLGAFTALETISKTEILRS